MKNKPSYEGAVNSLMRKYIRTETIGGAINDDYNAVNAVMEKLTDEQKQIVFGVYSNPAWYMSDKVKEFAEQSGVDTVKVWKVLRFVCRDVAKERGLIGTV